VSIMLTQAPNTQAPIVAQIRALHDRLLRAEILASTGKVHSVVDMPDAYIVEGTKGPYLIKDVKCPCPDATNRNGLTDAHCKHLLATLLYCQEVGASKTGTGPAPKGTSTDTGHDLESKIQDLYR
jgi:hypothetical protein